MAQTPVGKKSKPPSKLLWQRCESARMVRASTQMSNSSQTYNLNSFPTPTNHRHRQEVHHVGIPVIKPKNRCMTSLYHLLVERERERAKKREREDLSRKHIHPLFFSLSNHSHHHLSVEKSWWCLSPHLFLAICDHPATAAAPPSPLFRDINDHSKRRWKRRRKKNVLENKKKDTTCLTA